VGPRTYLLLSSVVAAGAAFAAEAAGVPDGPDREAVVREMLERSRLLEDARFRVARSLYERYVREALQPGRPMPAPVPMVAEEGRYLLRIPADRKLVIEAALRFRVLDPERCPKVRVLPAGWVWEEARVNGAPVKLATEEAAGGWLWFSPTAPGEYRIEARSPQPEVPPAGTGFDLPVAATVQTLVGVESPDAWELVIVGAPLRLTGAAGMGTHGQVAARWGDRLSIRLGRPAAVAERPPRYEVRGDVAWSLDEGLQRVTAELDVGIVGGATERLDLSLPSAAERVSVSGPDLREAQVAGGKAAVFLRGKVRERTRLRVSYEMPLAKEGVQRLDPPSLADGHWAGGTLVVSNAAGGVEVLPATLSGLRQMAIGDAAASARALAVGTPAIACEIAGRTWSAEVELLNLAEFALKESIADLAHYELLFRDDGMLLCKASYEIRNRARQFLRLDLPRGATVLQARVNEEPKPLTPVPDAPDAYLLPLVRSVASVQGLVTFPVDIVFLCRLDIVGGASAPREGGGGDQERGAETPRPQEGRGAETPRLQRRGDVALPLPRIDLPIAYAWCEACVPEGMRVRKWTGPLAKVDRYSNETATASMSYGLGMAAEGYKPRERPIPKAPPPEEKAEPKPTELPPTPKTPVRRPSRGGLLGILRPRSKPTPATADIPPSPEPQPPAKEEPKQPSQELAPPINIDTASSGLIQGLLWRNYYRAGKDFYERGDYANAKTNLEQAIALNPKSQEAFNASKLLENIKLVQPGQAGAVPMFKSQTEKAAGVQVLKQVKASLKSLEEQQREYISKGLKAAEEGRPQEAREQLSAAEALGEQLTAQGANKEEVESRLRHAKDALQSLRKQEKATVEGLYRRVEELKGKGRYAEALEQAKQIQRLDTGGAVGGGKAKLQTEIEELAVEATRQRTQALAQDRRDEGLTDRARGQVTKGLSDLKEGLDRANGPAAGAEKAKERVVIFSDGRERDGDIEKRRAIDEVEAAVRSERARRLEEARKDLQVAPANAGQLYRRGELLNSNGDTDAAFATWTRLLKAFPQSPEAAKVRERLAELKRVHLGVEPGERRGEAGERDDLGRFAQHALVDRVPDAERPRRELTEKQAPRLVEQRQKLVERMEERQQEISRVVKERARATGERWGETQAFTVPQDGGAIYVPRERAEEVRERKAPTHIGYPDGEEAWQRRIREGLNKKITFDFVERPLQDVVSFLSSLTDTNIFLDPDAARDAPNVTLRVNEMRAAAALDWVLKLVALRRVDRDGVVFLTRPEAISQKPILRMYDVTDLTIDIKDFPRRQQALASDSGYLPTGGAVRTEHEVLFRPPAEDVFGWRPARRERARPTFVLDVMPPEWETRIREALRKKVTFDFVETPLQDVVNFLSALVDVTIVLDSSAVKDAPNVTLRVGDMELGQALTWIMKLTGLAYTLQDEAVFITKPEQIREKVVMRVYDVTRLVEEFKMPSRRRRGEEALTGPTLVDFVKKVIAPATWDEPGDEVGYAIEYRAGKLLVTHTPEVQKQVATLIANFDRAEGGQPPGTDGAVEEAYDVSDLVRESEEEGKKLAQRVREATGEAAGGPGYTIQYRNGRIVVVHTPEVHQQIERLVDEFRSARGPQVEVGKQITLQKASGKFDDYSVLTVGGLQALPKGPAADPRFRQFVARNYDWWLETNGDVDAADRGVDPDDLNDFGARLETNLEQKVQVNGINLNVAAGEAKGLGVTFTTGNNDLSYAVVDEAQLRTLVELDAAKKRGRVAANPNAQETIVGTDAWLPNSMRANVRFAGVTRNGLIISGNDIDLPHEKYILISNGNYLTAVQANPMQHWTEAMNPFPFAVTAPEIEVPRVGRVVKFEKTLVEPGDELVLKASYRYAER